MDKDANGYGAVSTVEYGQDRIQCILSIEI